MLELKDISVKNRLLATNVTFIPGNKYAVIGVNGAGKSTLLDVISGKISHKHITGKIFLNGEDLEAFAVKEHAKQFAFLAQTTRVLFNYSAKDVIKMGLYAHELNSDRKEKLINEICDLLSLTKQIDLLFHMLSGGQKQRVHLARVILQIIATDTEKEKWLLLDEHVTGLDLYQQAKIFDILDSLLKRYNVGIIMVIHDLNLAAKFCDKMLLLDKGRLVKMDDPQAVILDDNFKKIFKIRAKYLTDEDAFLFPPLSEIDL